MRIYQASELINNPPVIEGEFNNIDEVIEYVSASRQGILFDGVLLFSWRNNKLPLKSVIISTSSDKNKYCIHMKYENYDMLYSSGDNLSIAMILDMIGDDKQLKDLRSSIIKHFIDENN